VFEVDRKKGGLKLIETAKGVSVDKVREKTDAEFEVAENVGVME
jgi:3-oxoacid CoA-transferase